MKIATLYAMEKCEACVRAEALLRETEADYRKIMVSPGDPRVTNLAGSFLVPLLVTADGEVKVLARDTAGSRFVPIRRKEVQMSTEPQKVSYVTEQHIKNALGHIGMQLLHAQAENESLRALIQTLEQENASLKRQAVTVKE